ncbi:MAG: hypothetical protein ABI306_04215 [Caulobacteraceae bacterium]
MNRTKLALAALTASLLTSAAVAGVEPPFNTEGNVLIADQFNNRVIEIAPDGTIVWQFGRGPNDITAKSPVGVNDALRVGRRTLISGTGVPAGMEPLCPNGCADNRVMLVDEAGKIVWQYGRFGVTGSGPDQLNTPVQATWTDRHTVWITDQANQRAIEVNLHKKIVRQYGTTGVSGSGPNQLNNPNSVEVLDNGRLLIADQNNNRAIEVDQAGNIVATFTIGGTASGVAFASRLSNGDTLITDSNNNRVVEVDSHDNIVWSYATNTQPGSNSNPLPTRAIRLKNNDTVISDQFNHRVIEIDHNKKIVKQYGTLNVAGYSTISARKLLNAPYDAKIIGENRGLTFSSSLHLYPS